MLVRGLGRSARFPLVVNEEELNLSVMSIFHHPCAMYEIWVSGVMFRHYWDRLLPYNDYRCQMISTIANGRSQLGYNCGGLALNLIPNALLFPRTGHS